MLQVISVQVGQRVAPGTNLAREPRLGLRVRGHDTLLRQQGKRTTQAGLEDLKEEKGQTERRLLDGGIKRARDRLREGRGVGLELEEDLRLARNARGRVPGHLAPHFVDERPVDGSHQEESPCDFVRSPVR